MRDQTEILKGQESMTKVNVAEGKPMPENEWSEALVARLNAALGVLAKKTIVKNSEAPSHQLILVSGWVGDVDAEKAIAEYLVGLRMMMVSAALQIQGHLLGSRVNSAPSVKRNVNSIVGDSNDALSDNQIVQERNPWIAEALWHLCLHLSQRIPDIHPNRSILAIDYAHSFAKEHGLDVVALYALNVSDVGLTIVETKAYEANATQAVIDAAGMFRSVNQEKMDVEIRRAVSIMRDALPPERQHTVTGTFWRNERTCVPNPHYDPRASGVIDWTKKRETLTRLGVDYRHVLLMPHSIAGFRAFFNRIADRMRDFAEEMSGV